MTVLISPYRPYVIADGCGRRQSPRSTAPPDGRPHTDRGRLRPDILHLDAAPELLSPNQTITLNAREISASLQPFEYIVDGVMARTSFSLIQNASDTGNGDALR